MTKKRIARATDQPTRRADAPPRIDLAAELAAERSDRPCMVCSGPPHLLEAINAWRGLPPEQQVSVSALWRVLAKHGATFKRETLRRHLSDGH